MAFKNIEVSQEGRVGIIKLNRPKALNALNSELSAEVAEALTKFGADDGIGCVIFTGSEKAFAAGADIKEMSTKSYMDFYMDDIFAPWKALTEFRKPTIAAVAGYALGGGCEVAMMCDIIIAADTAQFGQPEINLGVMPGMGGTQRLIRAVGKFKAMDLCLTGRRMGADEAFACGLAARVVPADDLMSTALDMAKTISEKSLPIAMMTKEAVEAAEETTLTQGLKVEQRIFQAMFTTEDQKEGMAAFAEKRKARFKHH